ncbi:VWA domain-containing protein [Nitratireductor alexandrii]|uniref:VWA domain-containing protein n=1 Tax=Nitratireductor alexandrii TaxID=2448161 RepID=UPI0013DEBBDB|nr:VWA domain-containing protein [Nitratireductor alexandrii]
MDELASMQGSETAAPDPWQDALVAAKILAAGGPGIGGLWLKARAGGVRETYLNHLGALLDPGAGWVRVPAGVCLSALTGSIDFPATALAGRLVTQPGLLARADRGVLLVPMAERLEAPAAALLGEAMDTGSCAKAGRSANRSERENARFQVIAVDESAGPDESPPQALTDRLGLIVDLNAVAWSQVASVAAPASAASPSPVAFETVTASDDLVRLFSDLACAAGARSLRTLRHLVTACRILTWLDGRSRVSEKDVLTALRLCLGVTLTPRQQAAPESAETRAGDPPPQDIAHSARDSDPPQDRHAPPEDGPSSLADLGELLAAVEAGTIAGLPDFTSSTTVRSPRARAGKSGAAHKQARRGRPVSTVRSAPYRDARPNVIATLRAAAPWQALRNRQRQLVASRLHRGPAGGKQPRTLITRDDYRYRRLRHETPSTAIFLVDASGSTALERLGETKGAIEQLLSRCYVRRDEVAMIAFRGAGADTVLPPTRSLVMAKRKLAGLPGGGPTPLAAGLERGLDMALAVRRQGSTPVLVLLTDGSGNVALDGSADRALAAQQLTRIATRCRGEDIRSVCIDIARRPRAAVASLAETMAAELHVLRHADASHMCEVVNTSLEEARS